MSKFIFVALLASSFSNGEVIRRQAGDIAGTTNSTSEYVFVTVTDYITVPASVPATSSDVQPSSLAPIDSSNSVDIPEVSSTMVVPSSADPPSSMAPCQTSPNGFSYPPRRVVRPPIMMPAKQSTTAIVVQPVYLTIPPSSLDVEANSGQGMTNSFRHHGQAIPRKLRRSNPNIHGPGNLIRKVDCGSINNTPNIQGPVHAPIRARYLKDGCTTTSTIKVVETSSRKSSLTSSKATNSPKPSSTSQAVATSKVEIKVPNTPVVTYTLLVTDSPKPSSTSQAVATSKVDVPSEPVVTYTLLVTDSPTLSSTSQAVATSKVDVPNTSAVTHTPATTSMSKTTSKPAVVMKVISKGAHCPYPYPREHCGKPITTFETKTKTKKEEEKPKSTSKAWCPYPNQEC
ncbi:hypothetical protein K504DRAFT_490547 [Pleomassaria siparia CBS 279.74]|uniref:Uncharacterized protein n=1 Tax=Pleomassaria siparia CBS 279.74 TaxID=1314801 RepID=A0A6G1KD71_9PLEO|nr:hypothetical protein K504DRAFT_490547 [Pleomassaria siparia CBS 279.74]